METKIYKGLQASSEIPDVDSTLKSLFVKVDGPPLAKTPPRPSNSKSTHQVSHPLLCAKLRGSSWPHRFTIQNTDGAMNQTNRQRKGTNLESANRKETH